jgi:hypothetical protein
MQSTLLIERICKFAILSLSLSLSSCDKIDQFVKKQDTLAGKVGALETQFSSLSARLDTLEQKQAESGSSYSSCVLNNMKGVTNDLAAQAVQETCVRKASYPISDLASLEASSAGYGQIYGSLDPRFGLYITVDNTSDYTLTEISVAVRDKKTNVQNVYIADKFPEPVGRGILNAGPPRDRTTQMRLPPGRRTFTLPIDEVVPENGKFFDRYTWGIVGAKGFSD